MPLAAGGAFFIGEFFYLLLARKKHLRFLALVSADLGLAYASLSSLQPSGS
jgi:hypothetical protein